MGVTSSRALSLLAALVSPVFLAAAIAGWMYGLWPANPVTLGIAGLLVGGGPLLGIAHVAMARGAQEADEGDEAPTVVMAPRAAVPPVAPTPPPLALTPKAAAARRFAAWRDAPSP
jgi:hypothetical protein